MVGAKADGKLKNSDGRTALDMARICAGFAKGDKAKADVLALLERKPSTSSDAAEVDEEEYLDDEFEDSAGSPTKPATGAGFKPPPVPGGGLYPPRTFFFACPGFSVWPL